MQIKCILFGHYSTFSDSGYPVCDRCGAHSYNDGGNYPDENGKLRNDWNRAGYLFAPYYFVAHKAQWIAYKIRWRKYGINDELPL